MADTVVHIYGAAGSGTTTLAEYISGRLGYTFMDTDGYFWEPTDPPFTVKRRRAERLERIRRDLAQAEKAVLSGALAGWGDELIPLFTLAVRLDTAADLRIERLKRREHERFGARIEIGGDMYEQHQNFLAWAAAYDSGDTGMRSRAEHDAWQKLLRCRQIVLDGSAPLEENFRAVERCLSL